ncbi:leucine-rich repeat extensin-like protein 3 [Cotesia glomerata]|uniref:leucine-rich repeat extensin-like protein 3 n=1 Tax=Cotesia glomerata TaxID=32391 RepID=UPI001D034699|nr:leucine-rich repeat extensin-like protein 3 [Cotesia glomerata]
MHLVFILGLVGSSIAQDLRQPAIVSEARYLSGDGTFGAAYTQDDGVQFKEESDANGDRKGSYSYIDPNGQRRTVYYTAGKNGFQASGDGIPEITPPTPEYEALPEYNPPDYQPPQPRSYKFQSDPDIRQLAYESASPASHPPPIPPPRPRQHFHPQSQPHPQPRPVRPRIVFQPQYHSEYSPVTPPPEVHEYQYEPRPTPAYKPRLQIRYTPEQPQPQPLQHQPRPQPLQPLQHQPQLHYNPPRQPPRFQPEPESEPEYNEPEPQYQQTEPQYQRPDTLRPYVEYSFQTATNPAPRPRYNAITTPAPRRFYPPGKLDFTRTSDGFSYTFNKS